MSSHFRIRATSVISVTNLDDHDFMCLLLYLSLSLNLPSVDIRLNTEYNLWHFLIMHLLAFFGHLACTQKAFKKKFVLQNLIATCCSCRYEYTFIVFTNHSGVSYRFELFFNASIAFYKFKSCCCFSSSSCWHDTLQKVVNLYK